MAINQDIINPNTNWENQTKGYVEDNLKALLRAMLEVLEDPTVGSESVGREQLTQTLRDAIDSIANKVPKTRTVNSKALSQDITLNASDVGAMPSNTPVVKGVVVGENDPVGPDNNGIVTLPASGSQSTPDAAMSGTSENVVQNKVIKAYVDSLIQGLRNTLNTITQDGATQGVIDTFNEVKAFLDGISSSDTLAAKLAQLQQSIPSVDGFVTESDVEEMIDEAIADMPTKTSDLEKDDVYTKNQADAVIAQAMLGGVTGITAPFTLVKVGDTWMLADNSPRITLSDASVTMRGDTKVATFRVSGVNLQSDISVAVENSAANWSVSPATIQAVNGVVNETIVTVTYSGTDSASANILVSTTGSSGSVAVNYVAAPVLALSSNTINLNSESGAAATATVQLTGANLDASSIAIAINGSGFSVSPNAVTPSSGAVNETLIITRAADASASSATLTITDATDEITINASVEWIETESDSVGDVVTRKQGYASADAATPTICIKYKITKKVGVDGATTNEVTIVNSNGTTGYLASNYPNLHHCQVPLIVTINGVDYKVTEMGAGCLAYCSKLVQVTFELDENQKTNVKTMPTSNNVSTFRNSSSFKGTDGNGKLEIPNGVTTTGSALVQSTSVSHIVVPNSVTSYGGAIDSNSANSSIKTLDYGSGISSLHMMYNYNGVTKIILRYNGVVTPNSPQYLPGGTNCTNANLYTDVYVPDDKLASYQANSTWATAISNGHITLHSINDLTD